MLFHIRNSLFTFWYSNIHTYFIAAGRPFGNSQKKEIGIRLRVRQSNDTIIYTSKNTILYIGSRKYQIFAKP